MALFYRVLKEFLKKRQKSVPARAESTLFN